MEKKKPKELKEFEVSGKIKIGQREMGFSKAVRAQNENNAMERCLALFGSKNKVKRRNIQIMEVKEKK
jgi:ribosomal protein L20A (L18A)